MIDAQAIRNPQLLMKKMQQRSFVAFLQKAWPHVTGGELISWNWHLDAIAHQLERVANRDSRWLIVNLPPRNGKSKLISIIWVAFMLGKDPRLSFVCVSYSNELSSKLARIASQSSSLTGISGFFRQPTSPRSAQPVGILTRRAVAAGSPPASQAH